MDELEAYKILLCVLRTQLGKTFTTIELIKTEIDQDVELGRSIHTVFTMNTLLNNKQFAKRLQDIEYDYGKGSVCVFSSKYDGKYTHVKNRSELQGLCLDENTCPRVVVMCSNKRRYDDGVEFLKVINNNKTNISRAFSYFDELHKYITDKLRSQIEDIHSLNITKSILSLSATPDNIWRGQSGFWSKLKQLDLDNYNDQNYAGYSDMIFNCIDDYFDLPYKRPHPFDYDELDSQTIGFIKQTFEKYPEIISDNTRSFIPAHIRRIGHEAVRELIFRMNSRSVVIVINGFEKTLQFKDNCNIKTLPLASSDEEVCETISRLVNRYKLNDRPIVITGYLCVGMGQTLMHESLGTFTSAIFGHMDISNDDILQLFGRITGRTKSWGDKYIQTQVYCPTTIMHRVHIMEECAKRMATDHSGDIVSREEYRQPIYENMEIGRSVIENIRKDKKEKKIKEIVKNKHVPVIIDILDTESIIFSLRKRDEKILYIKELLQETHEKLYDFICNDDVVCYQITTPRSKSSYKKHIIDVLNAKDNNKPFSLDISKDVKLLNNWQVFIDVVEHRLCFLIWTVDHDLYID